MILIVWYFFQGNIKAQKTTPVKSAISISQSQTESEFEEDQVEAVKSSDNMVFIVEDGRDFEDEQRYLKVFICYSIIFS